MASYQFDHAWHEERARLASLEQFEDPGTIRHLAALGVGSGWRCLEVGAGSGSIAAWLCERVGPTGEVLAVDLETRFLAALDFPHLQVRQLDITRDALPERAFDLIHERAVLLHLPTRQDVLQRLLRALRPGGWLLCEDTDFVTFVDGSPYPAIRRVGAAMLEFLASRGAEPNYGRHLFADLQATGLAHVGAEGRVYVMRGAHPSSVLPRHTFARLRAPIVAAGNLDEADFDAAFALFDDPGTAMMSHVMMAAWGQKPDAHSLGL